MTSWSSIGAVARARPLGWLERYAALLRSAWLVDLQYRADIALWLLWGITEPAIALGIWWSIAATSDVDGYSRAAFARYFFGVTLVNQLTQAWDAWHLDQWICDGEMNYRLARPLHPVHEAIADNIAYKLRTGSVVLLVWLTTALVWPTVRLQLHATEVLAAMLAILLAAAIRFVNGFTIGALAFWTTRATALVELQMAIGVFLSGQIAPLELLPGRVSAIARMLWFPYTISFPVRVLSGAVATRGDYLRGFAGQAAWLLIWVVACGATWRRGLRRYGAVGG